MNMICKLLVAFLITCVASTIATPIDHGDERPDEDGRPDFHIDTKFKTLHQQEEYFMRFYGLEPIPDDIDSSPSALTDHNKAFELAVRRLQHMAGIPETGEVDKETLKVIALPRCGVSDVHAGDATSRMQQYAAHGSKWSRNDLTYKILNFSPDMPEDEQESEIARALNVWSEDTPLNFKRVFSGGADIEISFGTFNHGDQYPFDGRGGVLAHAFFPRFGGDAHMDDSEKFTAFTASGTNMFQVMAHEFGHSMGLEHSDVQSALMAPFYRGYVPNFKLDQDDIAGIQSIYGKRLTPAASPPADPKDIFCMDGQFDAITQYNGYTFAFRGSQYVRLNDDGMDEGYPKNISSNWIVLPNDLDAAVHVQMRGENTYFFKGSQVWRVGTAGPSWGYPKSISSEFPGLPNNIDSAFVWSGNQRIYVTKGNLYYRVTLATGVDPGYPKSLSVWNGLPNKIDAAFQWANGKTYFFSGPNYYSFNDEHFMVDPIPSYPRKINVWWLGCPESAVIHMTIGDQSNKTPGEKEPMSKDTAGSPETGPKPMDDVATSGQSKLKPLSAMTWVAIGMLFGIAVEISKV